MLEGKKISELETTTQLQNACCFPVLSYGETKRITYGSLLSQIENDLPESEIEQVKEDLATLKNRTDEAGEKINNLEIEVDNLKTEFDIVDEMVQGQNATINNCVSTVKEIETTIEQTHFDDVLELEEQVRANTANIELKQAQLNSAQMQAVNSGITAEKVAQYDAGTSIDQIFNMVHPIGEVYTQYPNESDPNTLYGRGIWTNITEDYAGLFFRAEGGNSAEFETEQSEGLPNITAQLTSNSGRDGWTAYGALKTSINQANYSYGSYKDSGAGRIMTMNFDASNSNLIYGASEHVTPVNTAIRIWKRTA